VGHYGADRDYAVIRLAAAIVLLLALGAWFRGGVAPPSGSVLPAVLFTL
jgi:hypothetical protein